MLSRQNLITYAAALVIILTLTFFLPRMMPGDPLMANLCAGAQDPFGVLNVKDKIRRTGYAVLHQKLYLDDILIRGEHEGLAEHILSGVRAFRSEPNLRPANALNIHNRHPLDRPGYVVV